jgi:hypothetical protein
LDICDYPFIGGRKSYAGLASTKGIALTVGIAAAIIGSSFLIWYIPQSNPGTFITPPQTDSEIFSDVYSRHNNLAADIESRYQDWKDGQVSSEDMLADLSRAYLNTQNMKDELELEDPAQEWQQSFDLYIQALDAFAEYLEMAETRVEDDERSDVDPELSELKMEWQDLVDESLAAFPISG